MNCSNCGTQQPAAGRFCRVCGSPFSPVLAPPSDRDALLLRRADVELRARSLEAADEATARGLSKVIAGDGFFMVAVLLSVAQASVGSLLWLLFLIPAFILFGQGLSDVFKARQIRRRMASSELAALPPLVEGRGASVRSLLVPETTRRVRQSSGDLPDR